MTIPRKPNQLHPLVKPATTSAEEAKRKQEYIVYPIIPRHEITLIGGSPNIGTTTLLITMYDDFRHGRPVLQYPCYRGEACLVSLSHGRGAIRRVAERLGLDLADIDLQIIKPEDGQEDRYQYPDMASLAKRLKADNPKLEAIFLQGYHRLIRGNRKDYDVGVKGTDAVQAALEKYNLTLITVGSNSKLTADNMDASPVERFYGAISTTERRGTFISMERASEKEDDTRRKIRIITQDKPLTQIWEFAHNGVLVPQEQVSVENRASQADYEAFETLVCVHDIGTEFSSEELYDYGREIGISPATVRRYRIRLIEAGKLKGRRGRYLRTELQ